ncbi:hypothetical protein SNEBB_009870 [Seison nebaliae]|nr:hypothetical protein SNEBB_009870 [Seison nebaliae]
MWSWNVKTDMCLICRFQLMEMCANCQTELKNDSCIPVWGDCGHSFHNCCMAQWLKNHKNCPMCQSMWTPIQYGS